MKPLLVTALSSLSLLLPAPHGKATNTDPIVHSQVFTKVQSLPVSRLQPFSALPVVYLNKLRPAGTYSNTYAAGNCTYGVASRLSIPNNWGNANNWAYAAALAGYTVSSVPRPGNIAQTGGDSWAGHVAVVESVNPDGSFVIWEENYNGLFSTDERTTTTAEFPTFIVP